MCAHCRAAADYTTASGIERLKALLPNEVDRLQRTPFAVVQVCGILCWHVLALDSSQGSAMTIHTGEQVWVPLRGPVDASPLAMIDASSVHPDDYHVYVRF